MSRFLREKGEFRIFPLPYPVRSLIRSLLCVLLLPASLRAGQVIFTEVMYHPAAARPEYIEVTNLTSNRVDTAKWTLSGGVEYTFPDFNAGDTAAHFLKEYERVIISSDTPAATRAAWPALPPTVRVFGPWTGSLNNSGEEIVIKDAAGSLESTLAYGDSGDWPVSADGAGHSLQIINQNANVNDWHNWRASRFAGGSPGIAELTADEVATTNAEKNDQSVVNYNSAWKYWRQATDPDGAGAEGDWKGAAFNDTAWEGPGAGFFGHDPSNAALQAARGTSFTTGYSLSTVTYYFRTSFTWAGPATGMSFALDQFADDGVVYYLNGQELKGSNLGRVRMPSGATTHTSLATGTPAGGDAVEEVNVLSGSLDGQLITGVNVLCAEVHQNNISGDDIYFGARLRVAAPSPGGVIINEVRPAAVAGGGFVEFYNPTAGTVDLNGYYLSDVESNPQKFQITTPTPVPAGGVATVGFAESGLGIGSPVLVVLTKPDGVTRQAGFQLSMVIDGRSAGRKPSGGASWVLFTQPTPGLPNVTTPAATLALSEVDFAGTGRVDWVEVVNTGSSPQALTGYYVSSLADLSDRVALSGSLAAGAQGSVTVDFPTDAGGNVTLYLSDFRNNILGAAKLQRRTGLPSVQAWPTGAGEWYSTPVATRDAANNPERQTAIVINEIMSKTPADHDEGEYIELFNQSAASVDLSGWRVADGISFDFPAGTSLSAGQYLVLAKSPAYMSANYPGLTNVYGPYGGSLKNSGEKIRIEDACRNTADVVDYNSGGQWPLGTSGEGSSLELLHPSMDNNLPSSWRASDESTKTTFQNFTHTGTYKELRGTSPNLATTRELLVNMVGDGYVILKNIKLSKATAPATNLITTGDATSHNGTSATGFLCTGTHCESDTLPRVGATITGEPGFHLISQGGGDTKANKAEVDVTGIALNDVLTLSFDGRWVSGLPVMVAQTWDRSFGKVFRFPI
ncbi:MAG: hypothetical protein JWL81_2318, partial [Verrucomicrobiales bacterium]|nr:hypothetical protein [Verrucomicrobiales bacterium]